MAALTEAMSAITTAIGSVVTAFSGYVATWIGTITASGNEILLFSMIVGFVGVGIGLLRRLLALRA